MILACFIYKKVFKLFSDLVDCCDNYIYNHMVASQVLEFELHGVTAKLAIMNKKTLEYSELQLST